jgi:hypothetical protein
MEGEKTIPEEHLEIQFARIEHLCVIKQLTERTGAFL